VELLTPRSAMISLPLFLRSPRIWGIAAAVWFCVLWLASSQASYLPPALFTFQDKVEHACYFAAGSFCFHAMRRLQGAHSLFWATLLFAMLVGAVDEFHQSFVPGRSGNDPGDWLADAFGGLLAYWAAQRVRWSR
jgi:VanZ family protein